MALAVGPSTGAPDAVDVVVDLLFCFHSLRRYVYATYCSSVCSILFYHAISVDVVVDLRAAVFLPKIPELSSESLDKS